MIEYIFSLNFLYAMIRMATPLIFAGMAAVIGGKANILCVAYEAIMLLAALGGVIGSAYFNSLIMGMIVGVLFGLIIAAIFAYFVLYLDAQPLITGLALNTLGIGGSVYIVYLLTGMKLDTSSLKSLQFMNLGGINILSYMAFISVIFSWYLLYKTKLGLRIRAVGENPVAASSVGINVNKTKFIALILSGVLASFGGMFMSMSYMSYFTVNMTAGRGFIAIAARNLGAGNPIGTMICTILFGGAMAVGNTAQSYRLPSQFAAMTPYVVTILGLVVIGIKGKYKNEK